MSEVALVLGESLVDVVRRGDGTSVSYPGGSAANVAVALSRLDRPTWFATSFAADEDGGLIERHLRDSSVELAAEPGAIERTSRAIATIGAGGTATYEFDLDWRLSDLALPPDACPVVAHAGSIGAALAPGAGQVREHLQRLREGATISFDINARPSITGTGAAVVAQVERMAALADLVKASDEDAEGLWPGRSLDQVAGALLALGPSVVVITCGGEGARWWTAEASGQVAPQRVQVADTIGAGDTFSAGLINALWERDLLGAQRRDRLAAAPWDDVLSWAAKVAAVTVSRPGADPPRRSDLA